MVMLIGLMILGLCAGSFVGALVWRLHEGKDWVTARSQCVHCGHTLGPLDLVPLISFIYLRGRCRYCKNRISWQDPLLELAAAAVLVSSYLLWPGNLNNNGQLVLFISWLISSVGLLALLVYDLRWMILPNKIIYSTFFLAAAGRLAYIAAYAPDKKQAVISWVLGVLVASGIFYVLHEVSRGQWIGFGDVRLGLITGTVLADPGKSLLMIFISSVLGTLFAAPQLLAKQKALSTRIPYGPFLITATLVVLLFGDDMLGWYKDVFLNY